MSTSPTQAHGTSSGSPMLLAFSWLVVGVPLGYGVWQTLVKAANLFTG